MILPSTSPRKLTAKSTSLSKKFLLQVKCHSHPWSVWWPIWLIEWCYCSEMGYNLGYFSANETSWLIHLSSQKLILWPAPTFQLKPSWMLLPWYVWQTTLFKSLHHNDWLAALSPSSNPLQPPYLGSTILIQRSCWYGLRDATSFCLARQMSSYRIRKCCKMNPTSPIS